MSTKPENIRANYDVMDFTLSSIDMARIEGMMVTGYRIIGKNLILYAPDFDWSESGAVLAGPPQWRTGREVA